MSRKRHRQKRSNIQQVERPNILSSLADLSLDEYDLLQKSFPTLIQNKLQSQMESDDLGEIMKAQLYLSKNQNPEQSKALLFDPNDLNDTGRGYKTSRGVIDFPTLRRMGDVDVIRAIINTRVEQVQNFLQFSLDEQKEGFTIRRKKSLFDTDTAKVSKKDHDRITKIVNFLEKGGKTEKWDLVATLQEFFRELSTDSLVLDQTAFEITRQRNRELYQYKAIDASRIRFLDSIDPRYRGEYEKYRFMGQLPRYAMVWDGMIAKNPLTHESVIYYPWELGFGIRNKSTDIRRNGYGVSELETLVQIVTWILWGMQYNGNFFSKGSQPKGFINIKNGNINPTVLHDFRQAWHQTARGVSNSHRIPIFQGIDMEWIDLQKGNRDMEFNDWLKFLIIMTCAVYRIDPSELGFQFKDQAQIFGQDGQRQRLNHSRDKGLKPLLIFLQNLINFYLVSELDGEFEFMFTGIEIEDEETQVELDAKKVSNGFVSMEDMFQKYSGRQFDKERDTILNQVYQTAAQTKQQAEMYGSPEANEEVGLEGEDGGENPFDQYEKSMNQNVKENPMLQSALEYMYKEWGIKD